MRWLVHTALLAAAACAVTDATFSKYRQLPVQTVLQPVAQPAGQPAAYPGQAYSYYLPPVQRYIYLNGLPYAVLGEQLQYLPAASAGVSPYAAPAAQPGTVPPATTVNAVAPQAEDTASNGQSLPPAANPSATTYATGSSATVDTAASEGATAYSAPAASPDPDAEPVPASAPASETASSPAVADPPTSDAEFNSAPASASELEFNSAAPVSAPGPALNAASPAPAPEPALDSAATTLEPTFNSAVPTSEPSSDSAAATSASEPAFNSAAPASAPEPAFNSAAPASAPEPAFNSAEPAFNAAPAPGPALSPATQSASVYLSTASEPGVPSAQRILVLSVSNPRVTVRRQESVFTWHHPAQTVNAPIDMVFYNDPKGPSSAPASVPLQAGTKSLGVQLSGAPAAVITQTDVVQGNSIDASTPTVNSQAQALPPKPTTSDTDLIGYTLSQSPLLRVYVDPATRTSYYFDSHGHRIDLPAAAPSAAPAPASPFTAVYPVAQPHYPYYGAASAAPALTVLSTPGYSPSLTQYFGSSSGMPTPFPASASENYKAQDMTGLRPLERMYAPSTFNAPAQQQTVNFDKPLSLSISTGNEAERSASGPPSPLSPGDFGPSRGDSVENPAKPRPLW